MEYYVCGAGVWNSVFAVPSDVVDKYIKLAGAAQLKVLLWMLRNSCKRQKIAANDIAVALNMNPIDVKDCMEFWLNVGLIIKETDVESTIPISDSTVAEKAVVDIDYSQTPIFTAQVAEYNDSTLNNTVREIKSNMDSYQQPSRTLTRAQKPDSITVAQRISQDDGFASLVEEAETILARPLTNNDTSTLLLLHDNDGLPYEIITMILYFAKSENKLKMRYIEALGREWGDAGVDTIEKAEEKLNEIFLSKEAWNIVSNAFGLKNTATPTKKQNQLADLWVNQWGYDEYMLKEACEICLNKKGEIKIDFIAGIIRKWHENGILTEKDLADSKRANEHQPSKVYASNSLQSKNNTISANTENTSYDINAFEKYDIFD